MKRINQGFTVFQLWYNYTTTELLKLQQQYLGRTEKDTFIKVVA
jgi:hypothetical protein